MRVLIGLACVAIIATAGYFFWGEWEKSNKTRTAVAASHEAALRDLYMVAGAAPDEVRKLEAYCSDFAAGHKVITPQEASERITEACKSLGF